MRFFRRDDDGFTVIEAMVAVSVLAVALALTIQPVMAALGRVSSARELLVAENLAQGEIESLRALAYEDVGIPGRTPSGVLTAERTVNVEGRDYSVVLDVRYAGSVTGLDVIPQGGDGVEGSWDPGVDYKVATVTVTVADRNYDPVVMETIIAPRVVGAHEGIANARVLLAAYEPFARGDFELPSLKIVAPPAAPIMSALRADTQVFPAIPVGTYTVLLDDADGWMIYPEDIIDGLDVLDVASGTLVETALRVYRPATIHLTVTDGVTGLPVPDARLTWVYLDTGRPGSADAGETTITGLVPGSYDLTVTAPGYPSWSVSSVNVPENYPDPVQELSVTMGSGSGSTSTTTSTTMATTTTAAGSTTTVAGSTTTVATSTTTVATTTTTTVPPASYRTVTFDVDDNTGRAIAGATVTITRSGQSPQVLLTDSNGKVSVSLEKGVTHSVTVTTPWGHGDDSATFDPETQGTVNLDLRRPYRRGLMGVSVGSGAEILYAAYGQSWTVMPANSNGQGSFVGPSGYYTVAKRCLSNGQVVGSKQVYVRSGENRSTSVWGSC